MPRGSVKWDTAQPNNSFALKTFPDSPALWCLCQQPSSLCHSSPPEPPRSHSVRSSGRSPGTLAGNLNNGSEEAEPLSPRLNLCIWGDVADTPDASGGLVRPSKICAHGKESESNTLSRGHWHKLANRDKISIMEQLWHLLTFIQTTYINKCREMHRESDYAQNV